jgi:3-hydroxyisobutyrate dehydrogenase
MTAAPGRSALPALGFVGIGKMGAPMSEQLARAAYPLSVFDIDRVAAQRMTEFGSVDVVDTPSAAAAVADILILMLPSSSVVEQVLIHDGALAALRPGSVIVDMSSSEPLRTRELGAAAAERGVSFVDAPVSGGVGAAVKGTLTIMVGGDAAAVEVVRPVLEVMGSRVVAVGGIGAGHAVKALNNLMSATHLLSASEALRTAEAFGLDLAVVLDVVNTSSGRSGSTENKWPNFVLPATFDSGFALELMVKDMGIAVALAQATGIAAPVSELAFARWQQAARELPAQADHTEIARWTALDDDVLARIGSRDGFDLDEV